MIVKVCGVRTVEQARQVLCAGADWIGLNLVAGPRQIDVQTAETIVASLESPDRAIVLWEHPARTGSRSADDGAHILRRFRALGVRRVQLYGAQHRDDLRALHDMNLSIILVRHVTGERCIAACSEFLAGCGTARPDFVLLDAKSEGRLGGTGRSLDWGTLARCRDAGRFAEWPAILLAGGLTPTNVAHAIDLVRPHGVDVSSGVESSPGNKSDVLVREFVASVRSSAGDTIL